MVSAIGSRTHLLIVVSLVVFSLFRVDALQAREAAPLPDYVIEQFGEPPAVPDGPLSEKVQAAVQVAFIDSVAQSSWGRDQTTALGEIVESKDPRLVWIISDLMRFVPGRQLSATLADAASQLLGKDLPYDNHWGAVTDHLIAWDIPAPPDYLRVKRAIFTTVVPGWDRIFIEGDIDWRHVSWGGVLIDNRPYDTTDDVCNCIPAADNPDSEQRGRRHMAQGRGCRLRHRGERRISRLSAAHHGSARDGQRHVGRPGPWHSILHPVRLGTGLLHRPVARRHRTARFCARRGSSSGPTR